MSSDKLFILLNILNTKKDQLDSRAIIEEVRRNPKSAATEHSFGKDPSGAWSDIYTCYPLLRAIRMEASFDVIQAIYESYPPAVEGKSEGGAFPDKNALYFALTQNAPAEVTLFVLNKYPAAAREEDVYGVVPLHLACIKNAPLEVVSLLLDYWADAIWKKDYMGRAPLYYACQFTSKEVAALLLERFPHAARQKDFQSNTPLHCLLGDCSPRASVEVLQEIVILLLEKWPEAVSESNLHRKTPLALYKEKFGNRRNSKEVAMQSNTDNIEKILSYVVKLCGDSMDKDTSKEMAAFFIHIEWWNGVLLVLEYYPAVKKQMDIETAVFPDFLYRIRRCCKMKTMWQVIQNELDIMEGA